LLAAGVLSAAVLFLQENVGSSYADQNGASKTMICVYSLRAREKPIVSFPFEWRDLENSAVLASVVVTKGTSYFSAIAS
jgi:hypothetical protein